jgi:hypothetical protein
VSLEVRPAPNLNQLEATKMNWDSLEDNWAHITGNVSERWDNLTDRQLADRVQDTYGLTNRDDDAQRDLSDWQQRLSEIERNAPVTRRAGARNGI